MTDLPLISVIMATYNRSQVIGMALDSVLNQTYPNIEVIVVDDASPDDTASTIAKYQEQHSNVFYHRLDQNQGPGGARNYGIQQARGEYIAIMDDDDECVLDRLMIQYEFMSANPDVDLCFGLAEWVDAEGNRIRIFPGILERDEYPTDKNEMFNLNYIESTKMTNITVMAKQWVYLKYPYPVDIRTGEDWYAFLTMIAQGVTLRGIPVVLVRQFRDENRSGLMTNSNILKNQLTVINRIAEEQSVPRDIYNKALSNHYIRIARSVAWTKRIPLIVKSLSLWIGNPMAWRTVTDLFTRGFGRIRRLVVR